MENLHIKISWQLIGGVSQLAQHLCDQNLAILGNMDAVCRAKALRFVKMVQVQEDQPVRPAGLDLVGIKLILEFRIEGVTGLIGQTSIKGAGDDQADGR